MNRYQQQALLTLIQQMKSSLDGLEAIILTDGGDTEILPKPKVKTPTKDELDDKEDQELEEFFAKEREIAAQNDQTLKELWSTAGRTTGDVNEQVRDPES